MSEYDYPVPETGSEKLKRKLKEDPFVPIGVLGTIVFLGAGFRAFQRGESGKSQFMMRGRLLAQAFTIGVLCTGVLLRGRSLAENDKIDTARNETSSK